MAEYRVTVMSDPDSYALLLNGLSLEDPEGNTLIDFPYNTERNKMADILDVVLTDRWNVVATFSILADCISLVIDEEKEQCYSVFFDKIHQSHEFPTFPPIRIDLVDF